MVCSYLSLSCSHCISSILSDFVCFLCRSLSFLPQIFNFFVFVSRSFSYLRHCYICLSLSFFLFLMSLLSYCFSFVHCISSILSDFVCSPSRSILPYVSSLISLSFCLFLTSLLPYCLSFFHCISSILFAFVCFLCRSFLPYVSFLISLCF